MRTIRIESFLKKVLVLIISSFMAFSFMFIRPAVAGAIEGESTFKMLCVACHTIGGGRLVGPDLKDVHERREQEWLISFIKSSQTLIKNGDPQAVQLFEEYGKMPMPDHTLSDNKIKDIISYIEQTCNPADLNSSEKDGEISYMKEEEIRVVKEEDIVMGSQLFEGSIKFAHNGPSCISCHNVNNNMSYGGGSLAKDLTSAISRLTSNGVSAIINNPPFPAMKASYASKPLLEEEVFALGAFLDNCDKEVIIQSDLKYDIRMLGTGIIGLGVTLILYGIIWSNRKKKSVNSKICDRQVNSE